MEIGRLDEKITIQRATETPDAHGQPIRDPWTTITNGTVWADVRDMSGKEQLVAQMPVGLGPKVVRIRHLAGILHTDKVVRADGTELHIKSVAYSREREKYVELLCTERMAAT